MIITKPFQFEELLHASEELIPTLHPGILLAAPRATDLAALGRTLDELAEIDKYADEEQINLWAASAELDT